MSAFFRASGFLASIPALLAFPFGAQAQQRPLTLQERLVHLRTTIPSFGVPHSTIRTGAPHGPSATST